MNDDYDPIIEGFGDGISKDDVDFLKTDDYNPVKSMEKNNKPAWIYISIAVFWIGLLQVAKHLLF